MTHPPLKIVLMKQLMLLLKALCLMLTKKTLFAIFSSETILILIHLSHGTKFGVGWRFGLSKNLVKP